MTHNPPDPFTVLLERAADRVAVGRPPTERILAKRLARRRQRYGRSALGVATAIIILAGVALAVTTGTGGRADRVVPAGPGPTAPISPGTSTELEGSWTVTAIVGKDRTTSALPASYRGRVTLTFDDGKLLGQTGCNTVSADYAQSGDAGQDIELTDQGTTQAACRDEPPVLDRLDDVRHVSGSGLDRYLLAGNGQIVFELRPR